MATPRSTKPQKRHRVSLGLDVIVEGAPSKAEARRVAREEIQRRCERVSPAFDELYERGIVIRLYRVGDPDDRILRPTVAVHDYSAHVMPEEVSDAG